MNLVGKIVPKEFQASFRASPADFSLYRIIADKLEETGKNLDALCFRAAAGRQWVAMENAERVKTWAWFAIPLGNRHSLGGFSSDKTSFVRGALVPLVIHQTMLAGGRTSFALASVCYGQQFQAHAALLVALRTVDLKRLGEWARL